MTEDKGTGADMPERAEDAGEGMSTPPRQRRLSAQRKQEAVLRLLRGEDLELVSREIGATAADLSAWREKFLDPGGASLNRRPENDRDCETKAMHKRIGETTIANELLEARIDRLEAGTPFRQRRLKR